MSRELYKAFSGQNKGFSDPKDQIAIDELSTHTDIGRQEAIHPYKVSLSKECECNQILQYPSIHPLKTLYGRDLNSVLRDNLGDNWEEACATLMCEMRMYELECLRWVLKNILTQYNT